MKHFLLTIDVEDWFQVENLRPWFPQKTWPLQQLRIESSLQQILHLLQEQPRPLQATFFVLGWLAERLPSLVREIQAQGHEVASHGYNHLLCAEQSPDELTQDLQRSRKLLEDILGSRVSGYRAPSFSISDRILELIREAGYFYDASYNSFAWNGRYGRLDMQKWSKKGIALDLGRDFYELPLSNLQVGKRFLPCSGGGYFRLVPGGLFKLAVQRILNTQNAYHFYMHPWELDPGQPRQRQAPRLTRFRHYTNLHRTLPKLKSLVKRFADCRFSTCSGYLREMEESE